MKYSFVNFLSTFSSCQWLCVVRFEWDIVLSSLYDGWGKRGYSMWCPRKGTSTLLNLCLSLSKTGSNSVDLDALGFYFWKLKLHEVTLTT